MQDRTEPSAEPGWYGPDAATFGDRLAAAREAAQMTQGALARRLGIKLKTLQSWENDLSEPRANKLSMLSGLLNVTMSWLMTGEGDGLSGPEDEALAPDVARVLTEIAAIRLQMKAQAEQLGRLEKSLRRQLKDEG